MLSVTPPIARETFSVMLIVSFTETEFKICLGERSSIVIESLTEMLLTFCIVTDSVSDRVSTTDIARERTAVVLSVRLRESETEIERSVMVAAGARAIIMPFHAPEEVVAVMVYGEPLETVPLLSANFA